jgi:hypothetical protein
VAQAPAGAPAPAAPPAEVNPAPSAPTGSSDPQAFQNLDDQGVAQPPPEAPAPSAPTGSADPQAFQNLDEPGVAQAPAEAPAPPPAAPSAPTGSADPQAFQDVNVQGVAQPPAEAPAPAPPPAAPPAPAPAPPNFDPANPANYTPGRSGEISQVVIHVTQGSYDSTVNWFKNPDAQVSAHYVVRSSDGQVTQMVDDGDTAWHVGNGNPTAIGIEHEGFVDDPSYFTEEMYRSSAALTRSLTDKYGIPRDRQHIVGHSEVPGNDHTDPGQNWDWDKYMRYVNE